jgi:hypothetical protein
MFIGTHRLPAHVVARRDASVPARGRFPAPVLMLLAVFAAGFVDSRAALVWSQQEIRLQAALGEEMRQVSFPFHNKGRDKVRIVSIKPDCDCTTTRLPKEEWGPGEAGELVATLALQGRTGRVERRIRVTTDDAPDQPVVLTFVVEIPEAVSIGPRFLSWAAEEAAKERWVSIVFSDPPTMRIDEIRCDSPWFQVQLEPTGKPGCYRLGVRPKDGGPPAQAGIQIRTTIANHPKTFLVYALKK